MFNFDDKEIAMNRVVFAALSALVALFVGSRASAQTVCNQASHHWVFGNIGSQADSVTLGMVAVGSTWVPAVCEAGTLTPENTGYQYTSRQLAASASVCLGEGADNIFVLPSTVSTSCGAHTLRGFNHNGHELWISGYTGDDYIFADGYEGDVSAWAGDDDDYVFGGSGSDALYGGKGHDYIVGHQGADVLLGGSGSDLLDHNNSLGVDELQGETGNDCIVVAHTATSNSSCYYGTDTYQYTQLTSCENEVTDCFEHAGPFVY